jgi:putative ABC transport system permease protein
MPTVETALGPLLARDYPEIRAYVRFCHYNSQGATVIRHGEKSFQWTGIRYADDTVFDVFTHDIIFGDPETALVSPASVAVSDSLSRKYFGSANPVGETVLLDDTPYEIALVFDDLPENSSLEYDVLVSYHQKELADARNNIEPFQWRDCNTYLLMPEGYGVQDFKPISDVIYEKYKAKEGTIEGDETYFLQPLSDIHLNSDIQGENTGDKFYIFGFTAVALFILIVACINYMNLATARAAKRAKEIGIRKILGVGNTALRLQFLGEAVFLSMVALFFGLVLFEVALCLTPINSLLPTPLALNLLQDPGLLPWILGFSLVIGLISGAYPAFHLSAIPALSMVTGNRAGRGSARFRQALVVVQFTITVTVIACTLLMALQMQYVSRKPLGFEKKNRLIITLFGPDVIDRLPTIRAELLKNSHILGIAQSDSIMGGNVSKMSSRSIDGDEVTMSFMRTDENFFRVMGMEMASGREFSKTLSTDGSNAVIVNETMVKVRGWDEPLGQRLMRYTVAGVVKDFHFESLHTPVVPMGIFQSSDSDFGQSGMLHLILHISEEDIPGTLSFLEKKFVEFDPKHPFQYEFLDDTLDALYLSENRLMKLVGCFGGICIFISCLGLFGLAAFTTEQRTKEIGIRKVLGASARQVIFMLFRNILFLVLTGAVLASVAAYFAMDEWLAGFAYRTSIEPWVFLLSALMAAFVAFATVALQSYKTARTNPVKALRYE